MGCKENTILEKNTLPKKLFHYSKVETKLEPIVYSERAPRKRYLDFYKPNGLWVSVEDFEGDTNWKTWCEGEGWNVEGLEHKYEIKLKYNSNIIFLNSQKELIQFGLKYQIKEESPRSYPEELYMGGLNWRAVTQEYDGIIIAPYQWGCRLVNPFTYWYYYWDCASGCIWNLDIIECFKLVKHSEPILK